MVPLAGAPGRCARGRSPAAPAVCRRRSGGRGAAGGLTGRPGLRTRRCIRSARRRHRARRWCQSRREFLCVGSRSAPLLRDLGDREGGLLGGVRVLGTGVDLQLGQLLTAERGLGLACRGRPSRRPWPGRVRAAERRSRTSGRPGSPGGGRARFCCNLAPVSATLSALMMMTKSPMSTSTWGRRSPCACPATAPRSGSRGAGTTSVASMTCR